MKVWVLVTQLPSSLQSHGLWPSRLLCPWSGKWAATPSSGDLPHSGSPTLWAESLLSKLAGSLDNRNWKIQSVVEGNNLSCSISRVNPFSNWLSLQAPDYINQFIHSINYKWAIKIKQRAEDNQHPEWQQ